MTNLTPEAVLEASARALGRTRKEIDQEVDIRLDAKFGDVRDAMARMERKLTGIGSTVGALAAAQRTARTPPTRKIDPGLVIVRAALCRLWGYEYGKDPSHLAAEIYGTKGGEVQQVLRDPAAWIVERSTTHPAQVAVAGWAADLVNASSNFSAVRSLAPASAYALLSQHGARLSIGANASVRLINRAASATGQFFRPELGPLPVRSMNFNSATAKVFSGGLAVILSGELLRRSSPSAEQVLRQALSEDASIEVDSVLLGSGAATATQPAGLLNGAIPVTPSNITARDTAGAAIADVSGLLSAIPGITDPVYVARRETVARLIGLVPGFAQSSATLVTSPYVPANTLALIDADDMWSAESDAFQLDSSFEATVVSSDPATPQIDAAGVTGKPTLNMFQQDLACIRLLCDIGWGMRQPGRAATVGAVAW